MSCLPDIIYRLDFWDIITWLYFDLWDNVDLWDVYLTVPVDLRFLRYFSGTDASSWHSFSAHSLNPRPELSPPATCRTVKQGMFRFWLHTQEVTYTMFLCCLRCNTCTMEKLQNSDCLLWPWVQCCIPFFHEKIQVLKIQFKQVMTRSIITVTCTLNQVHVYK